MNTERNEYPEERPVPWERGGELVSKMPLSTKNPLASFPKTKPEEILIAV
jgi:hypothetical protein